MKREFVGGTMELNILFVTLADSSSNLLLPLLRSGQNEVLARGRDRDTFILAASLGYLLPSYPSK